MDRATSPFGLFRASTGPDFTLDILNQFDDIKTEVADEMRLRTLESLPLRPREITIPLGDPSKWPHERKSAGKLVADFLPFVFCSSVIPGHPRVLHITPALPLHRFPV